MTKTQREEWDKAMEMVHRIGDPDGFTLDLLKAANIYLLKLERELQALKNKKTMAALLMKKV